MKTILIPCFDGFIARNFLYTSVITNLTKGDDVRVVIIPPKGKAELYTRQFANNRTIFVESGTFWIHDRLDYLTAKMFVNSIPTYFMRVRQVDWYWHKRKYGMFVIATLLRFFGHFMVWHHVLRLINTMLPVQPYVHEILDRWKPDIIFAPTMIARDEVALMRLGKKRGARVVGMVKSWDNLTTKAFLRFFPDTLIVHNEIVKEEAVRIYHFPKERIVVTGIPQFDEYLSPGFVSERDTFFKKIGADPTKKLITYALTGDWMNPYDHEIVARLSAWIDKGVFGPAQLLLRLHPTYESRAELVAKERNVIVERPGTHFAGENKEAVLRTVEFDRENMRHLASTMCWSDVTINVASTMTIEAAVIDAPIILIGFDGDRTLPYWHSMRRFYDFEHYRQVIASGGARLATSYDQLRDLVTAYLQDRSLDAEGRQRIRDGQCYKLDGKAGERVAAAVLGKNT